MISGSVSGEDVEGCDGFWAAAACSKLCDVAGFSGADLPQSHPILHGESIVVDVKLLREAVSLRSSRNARRGAIGLGLVVLSSKL